MRKYLSILFMLFVICSCDSKKELSNQQTDSGKAKPTLEKDTSIKKVIPPEPKAEQNNKTDSIPQQSPALKEEKMNSITELWQTYKKSKAEVDKALENEDLETVIVKLKLAGECVLKIGRPEIAAWQFNNIGHYSIQEFKKRTGYENRLQELATMSAGKPKSEYIKETKALFKNNLPLLERAKKHLERAQIIDDNLDPSRRTEVIQSNIDFINWVKNFIE